MVIKRTEISRLFLINLKKHFDKRGSFTKIFSHDLFIRNDIEFNIKESYYTFSAKNVIRGMHFQIPPHDHEKLVYVSKGRIIDVILDIRKESTTFGKFLSYELSENNGLCVFIPKGCAHGFKSIEDDTCVIYLQSSCYEPLSDIGIKYNSFGFEWKCKNPIISERDLKFPEFHLFNSPFK